MCELFSRTRTRTLFSPTGQSAVKAKDAAAHSTELAFPVPVFGETTAFAASDLGNFPSNSHRVLIPTSHGLPGPLSICPTLSRIRSGRTFMAGQIHVAIRCIDVSMGSELSHRPRQQPRRHRLVTGTFGQTVYSRCLTQTERLKKFSTRNVPTTQSAAHRPRRKSRIRNSPSTSEN
jgi:hypothetical protein